MVGALDVQDVIILVIPPVVLVLMWLLVAVELVEDTVQDNVMLTAMELV